MLSSLSPDATATLISLASGWKCATPEEAVERLLRSSAVEAMRQRVSGRIPVTLRQPFEVAPRSSASVHVVLPWNTDVTCVRLVHDGPADVRIDNLVLAGVPRDRFPWHGLAGQVVLLHVTRGLGVADEIRSGEVLVEGHALVAPPHPDEILRLASAAPTLHPVTFVGEDGLCWACVSGRDPAFPRMLLVPDEIRVFLRLLGVLPTDLADGARVPVLLTRGEIGG